MRLNTIFAVLIASSLPLIAHPAEAKKSINVYTTRHYESDQKLASEFEKKTGIAVNIVQIKEASQLIARIIEEKDKSQADVVITADVGNLWRASEAGIFQPLASAAVKKSVPTEFRDPKDNWTGLAMRVRALAYNKEKIKPEQIARMEDIASPALKGRVLVRSSNHVYNQSLAATLLAANGRDAVVGWAKGVTANLARKPQGGDTDQIKAIAAGEGDVAMVNSYYVARLLDSKNPAEKDLMKNTAVVFPNQKDRGAHANISGGGITRSAKNVAHARQFLEFLVSKEGQEIFVSYSKEYPVRADVAIPAVLKSLGQPKLDLKGLSAVGQNTPEAIKILEEAGWR
ncbi:MAG: extracellular solute-binding protein [Betaproteobacteria bacterium]|nr:extracellular solute-binding protein [Betaproteobacteria bacterium]